MKRRNRRQADRTLANAAALAIILSVTLEVDGLDLIAHVTCGSPIRFNPTTDPTVTAGWRIVWMSGSGALGAERIATAIEPDDSDPSNAAKFVVRFAGVTTPTNAGTWRLEWPWGQTVVQGTNGGRLGSVDDSESTYEPAGGISQMLSFTNFGTVAPPTPVTASIWLAERLDATHVEIATRPLMLALWQFTGLAVVELLDSGEVHKSWSTANVTGTSGNDSIKFTFANVVAGDIIKIATSPTTIRGLAGEWLSAGQAVVA